MRRACISSSVFAEAVEAGRRSVRLSKWRHLATYDGVAVGAYVEQDPNDPVDTHRQGEFTADVFLDGDQLLTDVYRHDRRLRGHANGRQRRAKNGGSLGCNAYK